MLVWHFGVQVLPRLIEVSHMTDKITCISPDCLLALSDVERTCMALLNDSDVAKHAEVPPKPVPGTCQWIRSHHLFLSWLENDTDTLLWLTGHPGCGKTTLSYSLA